MSAITDAERRQLRDLVPLLVSAKAILEELRVESIRMTVTTRGGEEHDVTISPEAYETAGWALQKLLDRLAPPSASTASRERAH